MADGLVGYTDSLYNIMNSYIHKQRLSPELFSRPVSVEKGIEYPFVLTHTNVPSVKMMEYVINYDAKVLNLISIGNPDLATEQDGIKIDQNTIELIDYVENTQTGSGMIKFKINSEKKNWSGMVTEIRFIGTQTQSVDVDFQISTN